MQPRNRIYYSTVHWRLKMIRALTVFAASGLHTLETCLASNERWNNKFYYKVASSCLFLLNHTTMHGSMNIKSDKMLDIFRGFRKIAKNDYKFRRIFILGWPCIIYKFALFLYQFDTLNFFHIYNSWLLFCTCFGPIGPSSGESNA
jgi:hypothetical protein